MKRIVALILTVFLPALIFCGCDEKPPQSPETVIQPDELCVVPGGGEMVINENETLYVNGKLRCENGGRIVVKEGGSVLVNGEVELAGELVLNGFMGISEGALVYGEGCAYVKMFSDILCDGSFTARIVPPERVNTNGVISVGGVIIINKKIPIIKEYGDGLDDDAVYALNKMRRESGYDMKLISGFRSYNVQLAVYKNWCSLDGVEAAETYSSRPGHSEHQTGLTVDITRTEEDYADTDEGRWVAENCHKYGFIVRYPKGAESITGYTYEPWHLRYLGKSTATLVHDSGLTLEEFLGVEGGGYYQSSFDFMQGVY